MKLSVTSRVIVLFMQWTVALALPANVEQDNPLSGRDDIGHQKPANVSELSRRANDRGTWNFDCTGAWAACNNACYHIYCRIEEADSTKVKFQYDKNGEGQNRYYSGANAELGTGTLSPCGVEILARKFAHVGKFGGNPQQQDRPECDEFPMNAFKQPQYFDKRTYVQRNSLRCIDGGQNGQGGIEFGKFVANPDKYGGNGNQALAQDDSFSIKFDMGKNTAEAKKQAPYCFAKPKSTACKNDGGQFLMTRMVGKEGRLGESYNYLADNRYALADGPKQGPEITSGMLTITEASGKFKGELSAVAVEAGGPLDGNAQSGNPKEQSPIGINVQTPQCNNIKLLTWPQSSASGIWSIKQGASKWASNSKYSRKGKQESLCNVAQKPFKVTCKLPIELPV